MSWKKILKSETPPPFDPFDVEGSKKRFKDWEKSNPENAKKAKRLKLAQYKAALRMNVGQHGKNSEEVQDLGVRFMKTNPTEKELDDIMEFFKNLKDKDETKQQTAMDELRAKQKKAKAELDSKRDR
tara:strand:+ start:58 stop:438 length:381 start_codon:yes stop_codon:yes gene_type:complete